MLKKIIKISGGVFHLAGKDIDTDAIIPARFLKCVTIDGLGEHVFEGDRAKDAGKHPFDHEENKGCNILIVDENFGSGSSREHAVWALDQWGIQAVIGLSFATIFRGNALGNGLVCVTVSPEVHAFIVEQIELGAFNAHIDIEKMTVCTEHAYVSDPMPCEMPESDREKLITGTWDDIVACLNAGDAIEETANRLPYFVS